MQSDAETGGYTLFADTPTNTKLFNFVKDKPTNVRQVTITQGKYLNVWIKHSVFLSLRS